MIQQQTLIKPNETPILFVNFSEETFEVKWDGKIACTIEPKATYWLPFWLAEHAAKHLVDREMNKLEIATDHHSRESFVAKCIGNKPQKVNEGDPLGVGVLNKNMNAKTKEDSPKTKLSKKESVKVGSDEDAFEGK